MKLTIMIAKMQHYKKKLNSKIKHNTFIKSTLWIDSYSKENLWAGSSKTLRITTAIKSNREIYNDQL